MADVRSMLRQQRAARQQAKPQKQSSAPAAAPASKKRKAVDEKVEERKRTRTEEETNVPAGFFDAEIADEEVTPSGAATDADSGALPADSTPRAPAISDPVPLDPVADAELDAFMNEMDAAAVAQQNPTTYSGAVIEAAPMTAAEIAAQAREEQGEQRAKRDEEMEGEKEDAARALEEEFDEMEGLEDRVRKLREQREALRNKTVEMEVVDEDSMLPTPQPEEEESESDDEDWDDWRFRPA
ncbi:hypothetical protein CC80DRAFT_487172 [Byssothecium circinans]|uniref:Uncharacterized protein n=1 Tax=Byssothecium circinans TaxID=147558 RepID=A0A6A5UFD5_9PLEO|nr:hypothetical protein CC80DRAFT_487172 [Byssothecium circinans]